MRCKNCHTVMMDTDLICPSCRSPVESATAAAPGPIKEPSNLLKMLPLFGGAVGGLAYAALTSGESIVPARSPRWQLVPAGGTRPVRWILGLVLMAAGGMFLVAAFLHFSDTWRIAHREPQALTAAELGGLKNADSAPPWIEYEFTESKATNLIVTRRRLGNRGDVHAPCLLVRVGDKWLAASVAPGFHGERLVGRLVDANSPGSKSLVSRVRELESKSKVLPFEFNGVDGCASDQQIRYTSAGCIAGFGLLGLLLGMILFRAGRQPAPSLAALASLDWDYQPVPTNAVPTNGCDKEVDQTPVPETKGCDKEAIKTTVPESR